MNECVTLELRFTLPKLIDEGVTLTPSTSLELPLPGLPVTPTHAALPSAIITTMARETPRKNDLGHFAGRIEVTDARRRPGMWTPLMTPLDSQTGWPIRATGRGYTCGTGMCTCPRGQSSTVLWGRRSLPVPAKLQVLLARMRTRSCFYDTPRVRESSRTLGSNSRSRLRSYRRP